MPNVEPWMRVVLAKSVIWLYQSIHTIELCHRSRTNEASEFMEEQPKNLSVEPETPVASQIPAASRRRLLKLGAIAVPAAITLASGPAAAAASALNCRVAVPNYIKADGTPGDATNFAFQDADGIVTGTELQAGTVPDAYVQYINNLTPGQGKSCLTSALGTP